MQMSSKSKKHQNGESEATSAPLGEPVKTLATDSQHPEEIRVRAYEIYVERGGQPGHDLEDWIQAERELEPKARLTHAGQAGTHSPLERPGVANMSEEDVWGERIN